MSGKRSRAKGQRGERQLAAFLTERGFSAWRGRQYRGGQDSPDVVCPKLDHRFAIEAKHVERLRLHEALAQAREDGPGKVPLVCYRRARSEWLAILPLADLLEILREEETDG